MLKWRLRPKALLFVGIVAPALVTGGCVGSPPPPQRDLSSAIQKTADTDAMFEFSISGQFTFSKGSAQMRSARPAAEFFAEGSARPERGYRMIVRKRPPVWRTDTQFSTDPTEAKPQDDAGDQSSEPWLVLEETPGAVRAPGQPLWFSGRSGAMDAFGSLAFSLPPLGSPDTVFARLGPLVAELGEPQFFGQGEVRGHPVDMYSLSLLSAKAEPPRDILDGRARSAATASSQRSGEGSPSPSPSPTSLDGIRRVSLSEAAWLSLHGEARPEELTSAIQSDTRYSLVVRAFVDQLDNRIRRIEVAFGARSPDARVDVDATAEFWGFDTVGEFRIPVDTTFLPPESQSAIRNAGFEVVAPSLPPAGLEFTGLEFVQGGSPCEPISMTYTGRGRAGNLRLVQVPAMCGPSIPPLPNSESRTPTPSMTERREGFSITDTPLGARVSILREGETILAFRQLEHSWVTVRAAGGVSVEEVLSTLDRLKPLVVPIPQELSLPLPPEGPERR